MQRPRRPHNPLRRHLMLHTFVATFAFFLAMPSACRAQEDMLVGTWQLSDKKPLEKKSREAAIKEITDRLPRLARGSAVNKLRSTTEPSKKLTIAFEGNQVLITQDEQKVKLELDGKSVKVDAKGGTADVSAAR